MNLATILLAGGEKPRAYQDFRDGETLLSQSLRNASQAQQQLDPRRRTTLVLSSASRYEGPLSAACDITFEQACNGALPAAQDVVRFWNRRGTDHSELILLLCADEVLLTAGTIVEFVQQHREQQNVITALAVDVKAAPDESRLRGMSGTWGVLVFDRVGGLTRIETNGTRLPDEGALSDDEYMEVVDQIREGRVASLGVFVLDTAVFCELADEVPPGARGKKWLEGLIRVAAGKGFKVGYRLAPWQEAVSVASDRERELAVKRLQELQPAAK